MFLICGIASAMQELYILVFYLKISQNLLQLQMQGGDIVMGDKLYVAPNKVGRPRKIADEDEMRLLWEQYKSFCDAHQKRQTLIEPGGAGTHDIMVSAPLTYTIRGFCVYAGITETAFNKYYRDDEDFEEIIELMEMETEIDARGKFEDGTLNTRLAALWMGRHKGYSTKQETEITGGVPVVLAGENDLKD
jgi:hypothetical protein